MVPPLQKKFLHILKGNNQGREENLELGREIPMNLSKGLHEELLNIFGNLQGGNKDNENSCMLCGDVNMTCILACYSSMTEIGNLSCIGCWILDHRIKSITPYDL